MTPISFPEHNAVLGKNQPEYRPLPVHRTADGTVVSCWRLTWRQRLRLLVTGRVWALQLTFNDPLQPQLLQTHSPFAPAPTVPGAT